MSISQWMILICGCLVLVLSVQGVSVPEIQPVLPQAYTDGNGGTSALNNIPGLSKDHAVVSRMISPVEKTSIPQNSIPDDSESNLTSIANQTTVTLGSTYKGVISVGSYDTYVVALQSTDVLFVRMNSNWYDYAQIRVFAPNGNEILSKSGGYGCEVKLTVPETGTYRVLAGDSKGDSKGGYSVYFQRVNNPGQTISIQPGETKTNTIAEKAKYDTYTFSAVSGDQFISRMSSSWYDYGQIRIFSPDGTEIATNSGGSGCEVKAKIQVTGSYCLLVGDSKGDSVGNYGVFIQRTNNPGLTNPISSGQTINGAIGYRAEYDTFTVNAQEKTNIFLRMSSSWYDYAQIRVFAPNGTELASISGGKGCTLNVKAIATGCGKYTILAGDSKGDSVGSYSIFSQSVSCTNIDTPHVTSISPNSGYQGQIAQFTIMGSNFNQSGNPHVIFRRSDASDMITPATVVSTTTLTGFMNILEDTLLGPWNVIVMQDQGKINPEQVTFTVLPKGELTISQVNPASLQQGQPYTLEITGNGFEDTPDGALLKDGCDPDIEVDISYLSPTNLIGTCTIPQATCVGTWSLIIRNPDGSESNPFPIQITDGGDKPVISAIYPPEGARNRLIPFMITGSGIQGNGISVQLTKTGENVINGTNITPNIPNQQIFGTFWVQANAKTGKYLVSVKQGTSSNSGNISFQIY
ncbi:MAG TPA: IPT/TIG domain-containing protein [Methanospirillum sp.]|nr:IPT/TIG domain-containing protein [Methanospirillum sp.]